MDGKEDSSANVAAASNDIGEKVEKFTCSYCHKSYKRKENLKKHSFRCSQFSKQSAGGEIEQSRNSKLSASRDLKNSNKNIEMDGNDKRADKEDRAANVVKTFKQGHYCNQCGKVFTKRLQLKNHMYSHTGAMSYDCTRCSESFVSKYRLNHHISTHHNQKQIYSKKVMHKKEEWIIGSGLNKNTAYNSSIGNQDHATSSHFTVNEEIINSGTERSTPTTPNESTAMFKAENQRQFLINSLKDESMNSNYRNVIVFCDDGNVYVNSLLLGLAFPVLSTVGQVLGREIILPDYSVQTFQELVSNVLVTNGSSKTTDINGIKTTVNNDDRFSAEVIDDDNPNNDYDEDIEELLQDDPDEMEVPMNNEKPKQVDARDVKTDDNMKVMKDLCTDNIAVTTPNTSTEIVDKCKATNVTDEYKIYCKGCNLELGLMKYFHHSCVYKGDQQTCRICHKILNFHTMPFHLRKNDKCKKSLLLMAKQTNKSERMDKKKKEKARKDVCEKDKATPSVSDVLRKKRSYTFKKRKPNKNSSVAKKSVLKVKDLNVCQNGNWIGNKWRDYPTGEGSHAEIEIDNAEHDIISEETATPAKFFSKIVDENLWPTAADDEMNQVSTDESFNWSPYVIMLDQALFSQNNDYSSVTSQIKQENDTVVEPVDIKCFGTATDSESQEILGANKCKNKNPILFCSWQM